jgi:hypothetical protein
VLASVLDEIIPPRADGRLPGAGALGLARYIESALCKTPDQQGMVAQGLSDLEGIAQKRHGATFAALSAREKRDLLDEQIFVSLVMFHAYVGYYQDPRVVAVLGLEQRPPHPKGYEMAANDLTLLDPVRSRPKLYRRW